MATRTLKTRSFWYHDENGRYRVVTHHNPFDLPDKEAERGDKLGAFVTESDSKAEAEDEKGDALDDLGALTDDELVQFIKEEHPTINELLDAVNGDGELAKRVLAAENQATGHDPRVGLVEGLTRVVEEAGV